VGDVLKEPSDVPIELRLGIEKHPVLHLYFRGNALKFNLDLIVCRRAQPLSRIVHSFTAGIPFVGHFDSHDRAAFLVNDNPTRARGLVRVVSDNLTRYEFANFRQRATEARHSQE
jgi:hypothetical protein